MSPERTPLEYVPERFYSRIDLTRSGHPNLPEAYNRRLYRRKQAVLRRALARVGFAPHGKRLLEVGAGTGAYVDFWKRLGVEHLTDLDISQAAVGHVRERPAAATSILRLRWTCGTTWSTTPACRRRWPMWPTC